MQTIMFLMQAIIIIFLLFKKKVKSRRLLESRSSLSSSCSFNIKIFDVFLSFRGADTRKSFISFLYKDLVEKEIRTFKDDKELKTGRRISPELIQAIKGSRIAIVVVSATYTASFWCLEELVKILKLEKQRLLTVVPIFYEVDPCHVRRQIGEVEKHFKKHEKRQSTMTVKSWRDALTYLADLSGECSKDWEDYSKLVDKITEDISKMLSAETPSNGKNLIGIDKHMNELYPRLDLNSNQDLQVIGISGTGSMGRSALARHAYEKISHNFEAHCFIEDVRRVSLQCRKSYLQEKILSKMQGQGLSTKMCPNAIKARVRNKKVLLVANDVDNFEQLDAIADEASWFGPGSIIIINTPNKQLLSSLAVNSVYEVGLLRCCDVRYLVRSEAITQRENQFDEVELFRCYDVRKLLRSETITQRENQFGFNRSTNQHMSLSGTNHFSTPETHSESNILLEPKVSRSSNVGSTHQNQNTTTTLCKGENILSAESKSKTMLLSNR